MGQKWDKKTGLNRQLSEILVEEMRVRGISQIEMSRRTNYHDSTISQLINRTYGSEGQLGTWQDLFDHLGVEIEIRKKETHYE